MFFGVLVGAYVLYMMVDVIIAYRMQSQDDCGCNGGYGRKFHPDMHIMPPFDLMDDDMSRPFRRSGHYPSHLEYFDGTVMTEKSSQTPASETKMTKPESMMTMMAANANPSNSGSVAAEVISGIKQVASNVATTCAGVACAILPEHMVPAVVAEVAKSATNANTVMNEMNMSPPVKTVTGFFGPTLPSCTGTAIPLKVSDYILGDGTFFNCQASVIDPSKKTSPDSAFDTGIGATGDESMDAYINKVWTETM